ncbi:metallophosphoesterase family protein [Olivibacter ginsenosidimutans]|uniref:Metallophosphoesterase family protein n=1 Tax=Olivibacter ginsenosidimutans TaxID=1176537 RepID=A0ABP9AYM5_9SPHI
MRLAFMSDIHGNLPALTAVLYHMDQRKPDEVYCLGDLVNFAGWDNEVVNTIRSRKITTVQGNHDEGIGYGKDNFAFSYNSDGQREFGLRSIALVNSTITPDNRKFLADLPFMVQLEFRFDFHSLRLAMVHGSVTTNEEYVQAEETDANLLAMMDTVNADILLMGHTHVPYHKTIFAEEENRKIYKHAINVGSVGKPKHGDLQACYMLLDIKWDTDLSNPRAVQVHVEYVAYDTTSVIQKIRSLGLPGAYDDYLRKG